MRVFKSKSNKSVWENDSSFHVTPLLQKLLGTFGSFLYRSNEELIHSEYLFKLSMRFILDSSSRSLLVRLLKKNIVSSWKQYSFVVGKPNIVACSLELSPPLSPSGQAFKVSGATGGGVGYTLNQAIRPALAEILERFSLCVWDPLSFKIGSYKELKKQGAIDPRVFVVFSKNQLKLDRFKRSQVTIEKSMQWVEAQCFLSGQRKLIPAQQIYLNYEFEYPEEPIFVKATTNGAAAGTSYLRATYSAICESIERDSLLLFWLNKLAPPQIKLESIPIPRAQRLIADIKNKGFNLTILDITTDLQVPTFCAVLINKKNGRAVSMSAACDLDHYRAVEKVILEVSKFPFFEVKNSYIWEELKEYTNIESFQDRSALWSDKRMIPEITFFLLGKSTDFSEVANPPVTLNGDFKIRLEYIKNILKQKDYSCYIVDVTTAEAKEAGLSIVKAVLPNLTPYYVDDNKKCLGVRRLYYAPVKMGLRNCALTEDELNSTPHPFL